MAVRVALAALAALTLASLSAADAREATIHVDLTVPATKVSPKLYGIFFEEINHAGDGGLSAELIRNRSFEDAASPEAWSIEEENGATTSMTLDRSNPLNAQNPTSLKVDVTSAGRAMVWNTGYWGIGLRKGARYRFSAYMRRSQGASPDVIVSLRAPAGAVLAQQKLTVQSSGWGRVGTVLTSTASTGSGRLCITVQGPGTVWLDMVSLFPSDTWKNRPSGLRADLMGHLDQMRPSFVRFPGGCFVEGDRLANAFRWKTTIGDPAERLTHANLWGYRSSNALGYHEYLQMCEDLGAAPLFVINCGMAHADNVPMDQLQEWIQDALDAIEYANGPVSSRWGALRVANGHPAPFHLRMIEIGNENGGPVYEEHFAAFYDAIRQRYPNIELIANTPVKNRKPDVVDEHYYSTPDWFLSQTHHYDGYDRKGPHIYVGEYAVTAQCGQGNLKAALAEAAFMTGLERNADIVTMASYAPLFVNTSNRAWNPDAIVFDSVQAYCTPSFHVQTLFSRNRIASSAPVTIAAAPGNQLARTGGIGLGTWSTRSEFKDIEVRSGDRVLYRSDFTGGAAGWRTAKGAWSVADGAYQQDDLATGPISLLGDPSWGDYTLSLKARKISGDEGFLILFHATDEGNFVWWNLGGWGNRFHGLEQEIGGAKSDLGTRVDGLIEAGRWYNIRVELQGNRIRCYLDGKLVHDVVETRPETLACSAGLTPDTRDVMLKVVNYSSTAQTVTFEIGGGPALEGSGVATVLTGNGPDDENTLSQPDRVCPASSPITGVGRTFQRTLPAYSLTVLRLRTRH